MKNQWRRFIPVEKNTEKVKEKEKEIMVVLVKLKVLFFFVVVTNIFDTIEFKAV